MFLVVWLLGVFSSERENHWKRHLKIAKKPPHTYTYSEYFLLQIMNPKDKFYEDLYRSEVNKEPTKEELVNFVESKQLELSTLLNKEWEKNLSLVDIITLREKLSLPEYISLDDFNKLTQLHIGKDIADTQRYNELLMLPKHDKLLEVQSHQAPTVEKLIKYQWSKLAQWLVEIVANAIDASNPNQNIWRFWEWFYQALKFLENHEDILTVSTKASWTSWFDVNFKEDSGIKIWTLHNKNLEQWTSVSLKKKLNNETLQQLSWFANSRFKTNTYANVYLNWELLNDFKDTTVINGEKLDMTNKPEVHISIDYNGFSIKDQGIGMNSKTIAEKLVYPTGSSKKKINPSEQELPELVKKETKFFYTKRNKTNEESIVRLQVAGVVIEEFKTETVGKIESFTLECPSFTWLPESRNQIIPERCVVLAIQQSLAKVQKKWWLMEEKIMLTEMLGKIINKLKKRRTDETKKEWTLDYVTKQAFVPLKQEIENAWGIVLPGDKYLMNRLWSPKWVYFVSPDFVDLKIEKIPNIKPLDNIVEDPRYKRFLRKRVFYTIPFGINAEHDYLITPQAILVNKDILEKGDMQRQLLNTSINLNIWYELPEETVYYGRIEDAEVYVQNKKKKDAEEQSRKAKLWETQKHKEEQEEAERKRINALAKETVEKYKDFLLSDENNHNTAVKQLKDDSTWIYGLFSAIESNDLWMITSPESLLFCCITSTRSIEPDRHTHHSKYYDKFSRFILTNTNSVIASAIKWISPLVRKVKDPKVSAELVETLIELYEKEPEYMMQTIERFEKQYDGNTGWEIFVKFLESKAVDSKIEKQKFKIPYDEISKNVFTHPSMVLFWKNQVLDWFSDLEIVFAKGYIKILSTLSYDEIYDFHGSQVIVPEFNSLCESYFWSRSFANKDIIVKITAKYLNTLDKDGIYSEECFDHLSIYYDQEEKLQPFLEEISKGFLPINSHAFNAFLRFWLKEWKSCIFGLEDLNEGFIDETFIEWSVELDELLGHQILSNEKVKQLFETLIQDWEINVDDVLHQNPGSTMDRPTMESIHHSSMPKVVENLYWILSEWNKFDYPLANFYHDLFKYYTTKKYIHRQLQTNSVFRETLCEMMEMEEMQLDDTNNWKSEWFYAEVTDNFTEFLSNFYTLNIGEDYPIITIGDTSYDLLRNLLVDHYDSMKSLLFPADLDTIHVFTGIINRLLHKKWLARRSTMIFAWKKVYETQGEISDPAMEKLVEWYSFDDLGSSPDDKTTEKKKVLCLYYYLYFRLLQQRKKEQEKEKELSENLAVKSKLDQLNEELWSDGIDTLIIPWSEIDWKSHYLHLQMMLRDLAYMWYWDKSKKFIEKYPNLEFLNEVSNRWVLFDDIFGEEVDHSLVLVRIIDSTYRLLWLLSFESKIQLLLYVKNLGEVPFTGQEQFQFIREESIRLLNLDWQWSELLSPNDWKKIAIVLKMISELYFARKETDFSQPEKQKYTMFDVRYSRVFEEILSRNSLDHLDQWAIYNRPQLSWLFEQLKSNGIDIWKWGIRAVVNSLLEYRKKWLSENDLIECGEYTKWDRSSGKISNSEAFKAKRLINAQSESKASKIGFGYRIEQEIINFLKDLDSESITAEVQVVQFDNELEQLKSKIPITIDTSESWLIWSLFKLFDRSKWEIRSEENHLLINEFPEFSPLIEFIAENWTINQSSYLELLNKYIFGTIPDNEEWPFLDDLHQIYSDSSISDNQKIGAIERKYNNRYWLSNLSGLRDICLPMLLVHRNIYNSRTQNKLTLPQKFTNTMFDKDYHEVFNVIHNSQENDIYKRDDLTKIWLWELLDELWILEGKNSASTLQRLRYLEVFYRSWLSSLQIQTFKSLCETFNNDKVNEESVIDFLQRKKDHPARSSIESMLDQSGSSLQSILEGIECESMIINYLASLKERKLAGETQVATRQSVIIELSKTYPQDLIIFAQFLLEGGELLKEWKSAVEAYWESTDFFLSELISASRAYPQDLVWVSSRQKFKELISRTQKEEPFSLSQFRSHTFSTIEWQDRGSMVFIRECTQNSRDAWATQVLINYFTENWNRVTKIEDNIWMNLHKVVNYLLVPGQSEKYAEKWDVGMFGQWFWSTAIKAKEIRVKTGNGNWEVNSAIISPLFDEEKNLNDFRIQITTKKEEFTWTIIERVDAFEWIQANLRAMIWVHNMQKYIWNLSDISVMYWDQKMNKKQDLLVLEKIIVDWYWEMKLQKNKDNIPRWTKTDLFMNETPERFFDDLPARMTDFVLSQNLSINIPTWFWHLKSWNWRTPEDENYQSLRPYLFDMFIKYILKEVVKSKIRIPMLPEDYFGLDIYEWRQTESSRIAQRYINWSQLHDSEITHLKDKAHMAEFLVQIPFERNWHTLSLLDMKRRRKDEEMRSEMNLQWWLFGRQFWAYADMSDWLQRNMEMVERLVQSLEQTAELLWISVERVEGFLHFVEEDPGFKETLQKVFKNQNIESYEHSFYLRQWWESRAALYGIGWGKAYITWNLKLEWQRNVWSHLMKRINAIEADPKDEELIREMKETISHEFVHEVEVLTLNKPKRWTHEKDLEHDESFEKLQRDMLTTWTRLL